MTNPWQSVAENYWKFDTPLRPNDETFEVFKDCVPQPDPLVVVLGSTPIFANLGRRVWFIDQSRAALRLAEASPDRRTICKSWLDSADEIAQADIVIGDGSFNALGSTEAVTGLIALLRDTMRPGAVLAQRVFVHHELSPARYASELIDAFEGERFPEVRFLIYFLVAGDDGTALISDVDNYVHHIGQNLDLSANTADRFRQTYFDWRGISIDEALKSKTRAFFPRRSLLESMFESSGLRTRTVAAGTFRLASCTPIYIATF